jgi:hypothetical protein
MLALLLASSSARADGDPASDVLPDQTVFYPYSPPVSANLQRILNAETAATSRAHLPIKVALIASPTDLGAITQLFDQPQRYADFLDQEINHPALLVVMPTGYGVQGLPARATFALRSLAAPASGQSDDLARAAILAVFKLASAAGDPISRNFGVLPADTSPTTKTTSTAGRRVQPGADSPRASSGMSPAALVVAILALAAAVTVTVLIAIRRRRGSGSD